MLCHETKKTRRMELMKGDGDGDDGDGDDN